MFVLGEVIGSLMVYSDGMFKGMIEIVNVDFDFMY